jgi:lipopolysaccharide transport system ATP-binding protein
VHGRVGALIEVASGFHPDLTGRENIFLQGAIMGMKRDEITHRLDAIVDFAGVSEFMDTPVKRYSSGMNARLGFAIAAHLDPDVLIVDEVLSVGDMAFQERCVDRMLEFKRRGTSIVFVSHNLQAVTMLCDRAVFVRSRLIDSGPAAAVVRTYTQQSMAHSLESDHPFVLKRASLETPLGRTEALPPGVPLVHRVTFESRQTIDDATFCLIVRRSTDMLSVYDAHFSGRELGVERIQAGEEVSLEFRFNAHLARGLYHVECVIVDTPTITPLNTIDPSGAFSIDESRTWNGVANLDSSAAAQVTAAVVAADGH